MTEKEILRNEVEEKIEMLKYFRESIEWAKRETDEALRQFKDYYNLTNDSLLNKIKR